MKMARVMLISLGIGPSVEHGIAYSIKNHRPDRVIFFTTQESEATRLKVEALLDVRPQIEIVRVDRENNPDCVYKEAKEILRKLNHEEVFVDFTSGTKSMSAGLVAAALAKGVKQLIYVSGQRGPDGRVLSGTEEAITFTPAEMLADRLKDQIIMLFNKRLFGAALQLIDQGLSAIHLPDHRRDLEELRALCFAYQAWDWFDHRQAAKHFGSVNREMIARWSEKIADNKGWVTHIANKLKSDASLNERYPQELLIDLWLNAQRRMEEGHWVDAVARLYRLTELIAQYRLSQHSLDASRLETTRLPQELQAKYEQLRDEKGRVKLGLEQDYELLTDLGDPLGQLYDPKLQDALRARNESIAGHGLKAVTEEDCRKLSDAVQRLMDQVIPTWKAQEKRAQFVKLLHFVI
jgi:CRISPR-associated protein (TIGR02710 family)